MKQVIITYILLWIIPALAASLYLMGFIGNDGMLTSCASTCYIVNTTMILTTMLVVYTAIKWFNIKYIKHDVENNESHFFPWQKRRILMLLAMVIICLLAYYLTLDNAGLYCALITLVAATMCYPQKALHRQNNQEQN